MSNKAIRKFFVYILFFSVILFSITLIFSLSKIYKDVKSICIEAKNEFKKDCVSSLIAFSKSINHTDKEKVKAIWALGQIADSEALPHLENLRSMYACSHKGDYESYFCYEVKKAIKWCKNGNLTHHMYRNRDEWK